MTYTPTEWNEGAAPGISAGELNRIEDGIVYAHNDEIWAHVTGSAANAPTTTATYITTSIVIPSDWNSWDGIAWADWEASATATSHIHFMQIRIDGVTYNITRQMNPSQGSSGQGGAASLVARIPGRTTTGSRAFDLRHRANVGGGAVGTFAGSLLCKARRVS